VVAESAIDTALSFQEAGAEFIHMVDLDGAKSGKRENGELIAHTAKTLQVPLECGGGIRTMEDVDFYLSHGVERVILGTAAVQDEAFLKKAAAAYGDHIAVGLDCRNGFVSVSGWQSDSDLNYLSFAKHLMEIGVSNIIFTDIAKDGTLGGRILKC